MPAAAVTARTDSPSDARIGAPSHRSHRSHRIITLALLAVIFTGFLVAVAGDLNAPFGDSYEGRNGGVWGEGSRAIREDGPIASGLGARQGSGLVYARHPPVIYPLIAVTELVGGEHPAVTRAPFVLAAAATIGLLYLLLRTIGLRRASAFAGVAIASASSMFTVYGPMPDTPMLGLPVGLAAVIAWLRRRQGDPLPVGAEWVIAIAAGLTAWQAVFVVLVVAAAEAVVVEPLRKGLQVVRRARAAAPFLGGTAIGLGLTMLWVIWATGGPGQVINALAERSGSEGGVDYFGIAGGQMVALVDLFGLALVGLVIALFAVRTDRHRSVALVMLASVFGYALITPTGASGHDYWLYWAIAPVAFGWALAADAGLAWGDDHDDKIAALAVVLPVALLVLTGWSHTSRAGAAIDQGTEAGRLVAEVDLPADQTLLPTIGVINHLAAWVPYATGGETGPLSGPEELGRIAADTPDHLILVSDWCGADKEGLCLPVTGGGGVRTDHDYRFVTAADAWAAVAAG